MSILIANQTWRSNIAFAWRYLGVSGFMVGLSPVHIQFYKYFYDNFFGRIDRGICTYFWHAMAMGAMEGDTVLCDGSVDSSHDHSDQQFELSPAGFVGKA